MASGFVCLVGFLNHGGQTQTNISMAAEDSEETRVHVGEVGVSHLSGDGRGFTAEAYGWLQAGKGAGSQMCCHQFPI